MFRSVPEIGVVADGKKLDFVEAQEVCGREDVRKLMSKVLRSKCDQSYKYVYTTSVDVKVFTLVHNKRWAI